MLIKKALIPVVAVVAAIAAVFMLLGDDLEHIEDTNGADNYALQTITDDNIINQDIGALNFYKKKDAISNTTTYYSDKFTGVVEIYGENIIATSMEITVNHTSVDSGNFKLVLVEDDRIVHEFKLNELTQTYVFEKPSGYVALRVAGESADFQFDYHIF